MFLSWTNHHPSNERHPAQHRAVPQREEKAWGNIRKSQKPAAKNLVFCKSNLHYNSYL
jgi:hypothetical protein